MFEYNGFQFSVEDIEQKAKEKGLTLDDYLLKNPEITKIEEPDFQTPTTPGAVVEETAAPDMESVSEDTSLDSQDPNKTIKENANKTTPGYWDEFKNVFKNQFGIGTDGKGLSGEMGDVRRFTREMQNVENQIAKVKNNDDFENSKQFKFLRSTYGVKNKDEALNHYNNLRKKYSNEIFESLLGTQKISSRNG